MSESTGELASRAPIAVRVLAVFGGGAGRPGAGEGVRDEVRLDGVGERRCRVRAADLVDQTHGHPPHRLSQETCIGRGCQCGATFSTVERQANVSTARHRMSVARPVRVANREFQPGNFVAWAATTAELKIAVRVLTTGVQMVKRLGGHGTFCTSRKGCCLASGWPRWLRGCRSLEGSARLAGTPGRSQSGPSIPAALRVPVPSYSAKFGPQWFGPSPVHTPRRVPKRGLHDGKNR
jgi:hypothetical protein